MTLPIHNQSPSPAPQILYYYCQLPHLHSTMLSGHADFTSLHLSPLQFGLSLLLDLTVKITTNVHSTKTKKQFSDLVN